MNQKPNPNLPHPGRVLIVDDEEQNRVLLRDPLEAHGYEVSEACDGAQALELVAARTPDVILLDVMMPRMHGFELCQRLRHDPRTAAIPLIMVTALAERHERLMGIKVGATDFLTKPVDVQDVILRVGNAARTKHLYDQLAIERERADELLRNLLPDPITRRMKAGETNIADLMPDATVLFADLVNFTTLAAHIGAHQIVFLLNELFSTFDDLAGERRVEKIKTTGDGYLVVAGVPAPRADHAEAVVNLALEMRNAVAAFNSKYGTSLQIRIGIGSGPLVAGVIGRKRLAYDIWGETVNQACRLGSTGPANAILVAPTTCSLLPERFKFIRADPGCVRVKEPSACFQLLEPQTGEEPVEEMAVHSRPLSGSRA